MGCVLIIPISNSIWSTQVLNNLKRIRVSVFISFWRSYSFIIYSALGCKSIIDFCSSNEVVFSLCGNDNFWYFSKLNPKVLYESGVESFVQKQMILTITLATCKKIRKIDSLTKFQSIQLLFASREFKNETDLHQQTHKNDHCDEWTEWRRIFVYYFAQIKMMFCFHKVSSVFFHFILLLFRILPF